MKRLLAATCALALPLALGVPLAAQEANEGAPSPNQIVDSAQQAEWIRIAAEDLLVMTLAPDAEGNARGVVIQLMPAPFSQGWVSNIRTLARAGWYDGISVNRVQDNYVVQWGDPNYDNPEASGEAKALPDGLKVMRESDYVQSEIAWDLDAFAERLAKDLPNLAASTFTSNVRRSTRSDPYAEGNFLDKGWPIAGNSKEGQSWPVHCYGMVGVGRGYSPDTGSGAELYTVIGHAPRHLDRNIALVGRIIAGMEHLSSLPRGKGALGFYAEDELEKRTPILSIRVASDLPDEDQPAFEYLSTESDTLAKYTEARANRRDPFFITPAGGADICNIPVPIRPVAAAE
ncbi:peptidylprolyl isomerase [Parerythrobacter jejuensis]|uniref:peptidylprolyl isomerase n=1 Tax=Parerythrobacter jejuensis TaxID=795812 RepID=A0A845AJ23_9SPHN|nr:peptidylprolyl isomerase [Parerythrobacter jejuensis]MXP30260.1 peptidylprolyl isomerase [Parerythrobacter jejuensis]MXP33020.1 peptidylprolyl isomerase [Parerythrobacter jejuensis]